MKQFLSREPERGLGDLVAGVDEVGRGCLCGPVVAASVIIPFPIDEPLPAFFAEVRDSKAISATKRDRLAASIRETCLVAIGEASPAEIDRINILRASLLAMSRAAGALPKVPDHLLVDGNRRPSVQIPVTTIIKGDATCLAIAAASIVAKSHRDALMQELDAAHPGYGLARHAGYPTSEHCAAIRTLGPTIHHRRSFSWGEADDLFSSAGT